MHSRFLLCLVIYWALLICPRLAIGQKVALVLSGGGAKGIAHAGVLQALEENNIPIDYIVGASMGSVVGGFYAAGYTPAQIKDMAASQDLQNWINGITDKEYEYSYTEKPLDPSWLSIKLDVDINNGLRLDPTMERDLVLNINLAEKFEYATLASEGDFDSLLIPFRALASNIFMEEQVILDSGVLYEAVRASMAIPFMYRPVRINEKLMFDGGVYSNFPIKTAREEFNPDIIIGVNVGDIKKETYPFGEDEDMVAESILFFMFNKGNPNDLDSTDIFINVPIEDYSALDFAKAKEIYELGYQSGLAHIDELKRKIKKQKNQTELSKERFDFLHQTSTPNFDTVIIKGFNPHKTSFISHSFCKKGDLNFEEIKKGYYRLLSNNYFNGVFPSYSFEDDKYSFLLSGKSNPWLKAKIGGSLTTRNISFMYFGLDFKRLSRVLEHYSIKFTAGPLYESVSIGSKITFSGKSQVYIAPKMVLSHRDYLSLKDYITSDQKNTILDRIDRKYGVDIGLPINRKVGISLGAAYFSNNDIFNGKKTTSLESLDKLALNGWRIEGRLHHDNLNYSQFASSGSQFQVNVNQFIAKEDFRSGNPSAAISTSSNDLLWTSLSASVDKYFALSKKYSFGTQVKAVISNQPIIGTKKSTIYNYPGFYPLQDSRTLMLENFKARKFIALGAKSIWTIKEKVQIRLEGYVLNNFEQLIGVDDDVPTIESILINPNYAATLGVVSHTIIGPIGLHLNYYDDEQKSWGFLIQIGYLLFNDHSLE